MALNAHNCLFHSLNAIKTSAILETHISTTWSVRPVRPMCSVHCIQILSENKISGILTRYGDEAFSVKRLT